jgi:hypothetical protein
MMPTKRQPKTKKPATTKAKRNPRGAGRKTEPYENTGSLRLRPETKEWVEKIAERAGRPVSEVGRMIVEDAQRDGWTFAGSFAKREGQE